jgi:hypothetical protein
MSGKLKVWSMCDARRTGLLCFERNDWLDEAGPAGWHRARRYFCLGEDVSNVKLFCLKT